MVQGKLAFRYYVGYTEGRKETSHDRTQVTQVGNSLGVILPKEALNDLGVDKGATIYLTRAPDGSMRLSPYDDNIQQQIALGERLMDEHKDVFRALAK